MGAPLRSSDVLHCKEGGFELRGKACWVRALALLVEGKTVDRVAFEQRWRTRRGRTADSWIVGIFRVEGGEEGFVKMYWGCGALDKVRGRVERRRVSEFSNIL